MDPLEKYLGQLTYIHGPGVAESSYYGALETLLNAIGDTLTPAVLCVMQLKNTGAGIPDGGLFTTSQFSHGADVHAEAPTLLPERGAIEVKSPGDDAQAVAQGEQVARYLRQYRQVLVTTLRAFVLVGLDAQNQPVALESYTLAESEADFWQMTAHPRASANRHGERMAEYLRRVMLHAAPLATPKALADFLASYAKEARARIRAAMDARELTALNGIREALEETLGIHFQGQKGDHFFRATLVQTLFYGIFSAWILWHHEHPDPDARFDWRTTAYDLHVPVIGAIFERLLPSNLRKLDLIEVLNWTGTLLNRVDRATFFRRFEKEQAVQYFYEPFLEAYDPELRKELGVWYTPPEVVEYMVARVDTVLREELDLPDGLADPRVHVLDPCCGTGAYLVAVLERIAETLKQQRSDALWAHDLKEAAQTRIFGFELLPAPFVVSHLQLGLMLQQLGVPLDAEERAAVYLTNALTGWTPPDEQKQQITAAAFHKERAAADRVKQAAPILVILGNPPYDSFADVAIGEERALSEAYRETKRGPDPRGQGLNDLYVRFYRMAERRIVDEAGRGPGRGIVCFISNYSWLDGLSHPGMRERYLEVFDRIWIDSLNGDKYRTGKTTPEGKPDPSIFSTDRDPVGIQVGTAIAMLMRREAHQEPAEIHYRDLWGTDKLEQLAEEATTFGEAALQGNPAIANAYESEMQHLSPEGALGYPFRQLETDAEYLDWPKLPDVFPTSYPGVKTSRDTALVDIDREVLVSRMESYFNEEIKDKELVEIVPPLMEDTTRFNAKGVRRYLLKRGFLEENIVPYLYRPFDLRWIYWEPETKLLDEKRADYFPQVFNGNHFLFTTGRTRKNLIEPALLTENLTDLNSMDSGARGIPLYVKDLSLFGGPDPQPEPNLSDDAFAYLRDLGDNADPAQLFYHALAVLHSPAYRDENSGALRQDWPRVPLPADPGTLAASAALGRRVAALLDPEAEVPGVTTGAVRPDLREIAVLRHVAGEAAPLDPSAGHLAVTAGWGYLTRNGTVTMPGQGTLESREDGGYDVYLNEVACWRNVPEPVWAYTLGGYPVLKKWLSYRERDVLGRDLRPAEARTFTAVARRIAALLGMAADLDANYRRVRGAAYDWGSRR
jgi:hypothetical protein